MASPRSSAFLLVTNLRACRISFAGIRLLRHCWNAPEFYTHPAGMDRTMRESARLPLDVTIAPLEVIGYPADEMVGAQVEPIFKGTKLKCVPHVGELVLTEQANIVREKHLETAKYL